MAFLKRSFGLHARLIAAFSAVIILVIASLAGIVQRQGKRLAETALVTRAAGITEVLAKLIAPAVEQSDQKEVQRLLSVVHGHPDLHYTAVLKPNGEILARWSETPLGPGEEFLQEARSSRVVLGEGPQGLVHGLAPVIAHNAHLGTMVMGFSRRSIQQAIRASQVTMLGMALVVLLFGVVVALWLAGNLQRPIRIVATRLSQLSQDLVDSARSQETAGTQQAGGIEQTRRTMDRVLGSAQQIAERSSQVLGNAERTVMGNRAVAVRIKELNGQAERAGEILAAIMQVADRTDLLALNAALEGTKAGEAGRGFTLVAAEMRRLAESTMESVNGIRQLMNDMRAASQVAVHAGHEGVALSEETTRSARDIALETQQQRKATEEVGRSMDDMAASVSETMTRTRRTVSHAAELAQAATNLSMLVGGGRSTPSAKPSQAAPALGERTTESDR
jgi:hypothetical protein